MEAKNHRIDHSRDQATHECANGARPRVARRQKAEPAPIPAGLEEVALITGPAFAAVIGVCISELHDRVRRGVAPQPVIRSHRCTRWRLIDAKRYAIDLAARGIAEQQAPSSVIARATSASAKARAARVAKRTSGTQEGEV